MVNGYDSPPVDDVGFDDDQQRAAAIAAENAHLAEVESELRELAGHIYAAQARYLELVAEFDRLKGWADRGYRSGAQWLSVTVGASLPAAREQLRLGAALAEFPEAQAALASGELSYDKAAAATKVMTADNCSDLVHMARHAAPSDLQSFVSGYLAADRARREEAGLIVDDPTQRYLRAWFDDTGFFRLRARLEPDEGAAVRRALEAAEEALFRASPNDQAARDTECRGADALVAVAEMALASDDLPDTSSADRYQVLVTVDAATLGGHGDDLAMVDDSVALSRRALEHLACDCSMVTLVYWTTDAASSSSIARGPS